jgi:general secretion pathway protein I
MTQGERGFTLLELLVAFVIAALALGVMFRGTLDGLRAAQVADRYVEAMIRAQSHLAELAAGNLTPDDRQGNDGDGFHWHIRITPIAVARPAVGTSTRETPGVPALYAVNVAVSWLDGSPRTVQLHSERIGLAPLRGP